MELIWLELYLVQVLFINLPPNKFLSGQQNRKFFSMDRGELTGGALKKPSEEGLMLTLLLNAD